ncbi:hypothetical protein ABT174_40640 [Streptomyces sparsogenes]|uniref:hypothetical protein n=1 Tax=Streptomyces sparsogenes TaxID=67365 RepID=UPI0033323C9E
MGCGCGGARKLSTGARSDTRTGKTLYQVVLNGGTGRVAFQTHNETLASNVARNYAGSIVLPAGAGGAAPGIPAAEAAET